MRLQSSFDGNSHPETLRSRAHTPGMAAVTLLTSIDALDRLRLRWHALWLETRDADLFQTYGWFRAAVGRGIDGGALVVRDGRDVCGVVPLQIQRHRTPLGVARILRFPIPSWVPTFGPVGPEPTRTWLAVLDYLRRHAHQWDACDWRGIDVAHVDRHRLVTASRFRGFRFTAVPESHWLCQPLGETEPARQCVTGGESWGAHECQAFQRDQSSCSDYRVARAGRTTCYALHRPKFRIETSVPPRPAIVNPLDATSAGERTWDAADAPTAETDDVVWGCATAEGKWSPLLRRVGAATGDIVRYGAWQGSVPVAQWWVVRGGEHWSVIGRQRCAGDLGEAAEEELGHEVRHDAQAAGKKRLWIVGHCAQSKRQAPVRYLAASGQSWSGRWYVLRTARRLKAARRSAEKETRNWERVPVP